MLAATYTMSSTRDARWVQSLLTGTDHLCLPINDRGVSRGAVGSIDGTLVDIAKARTNHHPVRIFCDLYIEFIL